MTLSSRERDAARDGGRRRGPLLGDRRRAAAAAWDTLLERIRERPGLADFLAPAALDTLRGQTADGPIVFVTADASRCDALILTADPARPVVHVPLSITIDDAYREATAFTAAATSPARTRPGPNCSPLSVSSTGYSAGCGTRSPTRY